MLFALYIWMIFLSSHGLLLHTNSTYGFCGNFKPLAYMLRQKNVYLNLQSLSIWAMLSLKVA